MSLRNKVQSGFGILFLGNVTCQPKIIIIKWLKCLDSYQTRRLSFSNLIITYYYMKFY